MDKCVFRPIHCVFWPSSQESFGVACGIAADSRRTASQSSASPVLTRPSNDTKTQAFGPIMRIADVTARITSDCTSSLRGFREKQHPPCPGYHTPRGICNSLRGTDVAIARHDMRRGYSKLGSLHHYEAGANDHSHNNPGSVTGDRYHAGEQALAWSRLQERVRGSIWLDFAVFGRETHIRPQIEPIPYTVVPHCVGAHGANVSS